MSTKASTDARAAAESRGGRVPYTSAVSVVPEMPGTPDEPDKPDKPGTPEAADTVGAPDKPGASDKPDVPVTGRIRFGCPDFGPIVSLSVGDRHPAAASADTAANTTRVARNFRTWAHLDSVPGS